MSEIAFIPFEPDHLAGLKLQAAQTYFQENVRDPAYRRHLKVAGLSWSGEVNGRVVGAAGVLPQASGRAIVWALFSRDIPFKGWLPITRFVKKVLADAHGAGIRRIEAIVDPAHGAGVRWAERLGFVCETPWGMAGFGADGKTYLLFAHVEGDQK